MNVISTTPTRYDHGSVVLHWLTAMLVVSLWLLGQTIDWFPEGEPRSAARSLHIVFGVALGLVLASRLWWRLGADSRVPPAGTSWQDRVAVLTHVLLYVLLTVTLLLGIGTAWIRGDTLFNLFTIPAFDPGNKSLGETLQDWHGLAANALLFVALFHAAAGLVHHFVLRDDVLRRMLPMRSRR